MVILGLDRLNYWYFEPGEVGQRNVVGEGSDYYVPQNVRIHKLPYDLFVNRILGLWFVGFGTGDMEVLVSSPDGQRHFTLRNIWRVGRRDDEIRELIGAKQFMQSGKG